MAESSLRDPADAVKPSRQCSGSILAPAINAYGFFDLGVSEPNLACALDRLYVTAEVLCEPNTVEEV
jgi:hypothetical protein